MAAPPKVDDFNPTPDPTSPTGGTDDPQAVTNGSATSSSPGSIIAAIDAAIALGVDVASYTVNGRTTTLRGLGELIAARKYYQSVLNATQGLRRTRAKLIRP